jgi:hypothetical protein
MIKLFKRLICKHAWKDLNNTLLRTRAEPTDLVSGLTVNMKWDYHSILQKCVKCEHIRIVEKREERPF